MVQIDLRGFTPGPYRIEIVNGAGNIVPGRGFPVYIAPRAGVENWFGVIDIGLGTGAFALFNANGTLRAPRYVLRFLNRASDLVFALARFADEPNPRMFEGRSGT